MKQYIKKIIPAAALMLTLGMTSCDGDLDVTPINPYLEIELDENQLFSKCYGVLALQGNSGGDGDCDIDDLDGGTSSFVRQLFNSNELPTDEAVCWWGDAGIHEFCDNNYNASHPMMNGFFARLTIGIVYCNQYLSEAGGYDPTMTAEVRFLRAMEYYFLMDAFGKVPFQTEPLTTPTEKSRSEIFEWIEQELLEVEPLLSPAKAKKSGEIGYGRADQASVWALLERLYLNAEVYTGKARWEDALKYAEKIINEGAAAGYKLNTQPAIDIYGVEWSPYQMLFMADNGETDAAYESLFSIMADGVYTTTYGTSYFLIAGMYDADMHEHPGIPTAVNGIVTNGQWAGYRARPDLVAKFFTNGDAPHVAGYDMVYEAGDDRAIFNGIGHDLSIGDNTGFKQGYAVAKYNNFTSSGAAVHNPITFSDGDFFLFRVAEAYLTAAEADARMNAGRTTEKGTKYINILRERAHAETKAPSATYSLNEILDEWSREFYFECRRRVDLIRHGKFGGNNDYNWEGKGGVLAGRNFESYKNIYAIPASSVSSVLTQNPGY